MKNKTAIIGGGICGFYLAWKLSEKGYQVTLFEKEKEAGIKKACSGLFSERILGFIPQSRKLTENRINSVNIYFPKKKTRVEFSKEFLAMNHSELDKTVFKLAQKAGAEIIFNKTIDSLPKGFDRIIGCDGANSSVREQLGLPNPDFRLGILGFKKEKSKKDYVDVWPLKEGFIWKIPRGEKVEYGILSNPKRAVRELEGFLKKNNIHLKEREARLVPQGLIIPSSDKITLCGDAAGMTKPWSGGGVVWGLTAAEILLKSFPDFLEYKRKARRFFLPKLIFSKTATTLVYFLGFKLPWLLPSKNKMESDFLR